MFTLYKWVEVTPEEYPLINSLIKNRVPYDIFIIYKTTNNKVMTGSVPNLNSFRASKYRITHYMVVSLSNEEH